MDETCIGKLPRFQLIDRTQIFLRTTDVESLIAEDHPVRAIWMFLDRLDLSRFSEEQRAVEGSVGRSAISPQLLLSIWIYSYARGVSSARQISREMEHEPCLQWLAGVLLAQAKGKNRLLAATFTVLAVFVVWGAAALGPLSL